MNAQAMMKLRQADPERIRPGGGRDAAVLIPLIRAKSGYEVLFEVRKKTIHQGGEICFPGGRIDPSETAADAAARETCEELGITRNQIKVITPLHQIIGPGNVIVTSYLGELTSYEGSYSEKEVDHTFSVPLSYFIKYRPNCYDAEMKIMTPEDFPYEKIPGGKDYRFRKIPHPIWFYETEEGTIWGMTAELLYRAVEKMRPVFKDFG
jgi:coenzyme A diphosphatase NUDT7